MITLATASGGQAGITLLLTRLAPILIAISALLGRELPGITLLQTPTIIATMITAVIPGMAGEPITPSQTLIAQIPMIISATVFPAEAHTTHTLIQHTQVFMIGNDGEYTYSISLIDLIELQS